MVGDFSFFLPYLWMANKWHMGDVIMTKKKDFFCANPHRRNERNKKKRLKEKRKKKMKWEYCWNEVFCNFIPPVFVSLVFSILNSVCSSSLFFSFRILSIYRLLYVSFVVSSLSFENENIKNVRNTGTWDNVIAVRSWVIHI